MSMMSFQFTVSQCKVTYLSDVLHLQVIDRRDALLLRPDKLKTLNVLCGKPRTSIS